MMAWSHIQNAGQGLPLLVNSFDSSNLGNLITFFYENLEENLNYSKLTTINFFSVMTVDVILTAEHQSSLF